MGGDLPGHHAGGLDHWARSGESSPTSASNMTTYSAFLLASPDIGLTLLRMASVDRLASIAHAQRLVSARCPDTLENASDPAFQSPPRTARRAHSPRQTRSPRGGTPSRAAAGSASVRRDEHARIGGGGEDARLAFSRRCRNAVIAVQPLRAASSCEMVLVLTGVPGDAVLQGRCGGFGREAIVLEMRSPSGSTGSTRRRGARCTAPCEHAYESHPEQSMVLVRLWERDRRPQTDLASACHRDAPTMTASSTRRARAASSRAVEDKDARFAS